MHTVPQTFIATMLLNFFLVLTTSIATFASASPLAQRDAGTGLLITDLLRLDRAIRNITYAAGNYTGGHADYEPIREALAQVNTTNRIA